MSSPYIRHNTSDPDDDQHIMPPVPNPDEPKHPLGPRIYIRLLVNTSDAGWTAYWEDFHMNERFGMGWIPGATFWWEEKQRWLVPEETPAKVGMEHGHTLRVITAKEPEAHDTVPLVRLHGEKFPEKMLATRKNKRIQGRVSRSAWCPDIHTHHECDDCQALGEK